VRAGTAGNVVLYTTLMHACARGGQGARAMRIFRTMEAQGLPLDVVWNSLPSPTHECARKARLPVLVLTSWHLSALLLADMAQSISC
jgi:pentatricopeptide repeat protein